MAFDIDRIDKLLPPELSEQKKDRLKESLSQFLKVNQNKTKYYSGFYASQKYSYFLQGDIVRELRFPSFNFETKQYQKNYFDVILLSNTCDMEEGNIRSVKKKVIIAKLIPFNIFIESLDELKINKAADIITQIQSQLYSNVIYLPPNDYGKEYIAYLDDISWITTSELASLKSEINENRVCSLDFYGYYLFITKLSYHFCRLPEQTHR